MEVASETQLRFDSMTSELAEATASLVRATRSAALLPEQPQPTVLGAVPQFVAQTRSAWAQWLSNLAIHLHPRSVILQNSVRLALGLSVARLVAGVLDLSHGFWVLLATLTLLRTTTSATRGGLRPVLVGTLAGAVLAGLLLVLSGEHTVVFVLLLPVVMLVGLAATPLGHPAVGQAFFTLAVAALFSQFTPSDWQLAESRVVDVLVGAVIGVGTGVLVWPRGGAGPLRAALGPLRPRDREAGAAVGRTVRRRRRRARGPSAARHPLRRGPRGRDVLPVHGRVAGGRRRGA